MHCGGASIGDVGGRAQPVKVSEVLAVNQRVDVHRLRRKAFLDRRRRDGLGQDMGWRGIKSQIHVGEVFAVEIVKVTVIR